VIRKYWFR